MYADELSSQLNLTNGKDVGKDLTSKDINLLSDDQVLQLHELYQETKKTPQS